LLVFITFDSFLYVRHVYQQIDIRAYHAALEWNSALSLQRAQSTVQVKSQKGFETM